jgi:hypothetical protein
MNWLKTTIISLLTLSALLVLYTEFLLDCENKRTGNCSSRSQRMMGAMAFTSFAVASILFLYMYFKNSGGNNRTSSNVSAVNSARTFSAVPNSMGSMNTSRGY